jgi:type VI secretion system secreted protein Hcp
MSGNIVLNIPTIDGNCEITGYAKKIIVHSYSHGVSANLAAEPSNTNRTSAPPNVSEFNFSKESDSATNKLYQACVRATNLGSCTLTVFKASGTTLLKAFEYVFENALISSISTSGGGGDPSDSFSLNFTKLTSTYVVQTDAVAGGGNLPWSYDRKAKVAT